MIELLSNLDASALVNVALGLLVIYVLFHRRGGSPPMAPEWRVFWIKFIENNTGVCWAFLVIIVFLWGLFHASHNGGDATLTETMKNVLLVASGWMGNMLRGSATRAPEKTELQPGVQGTQETETVVTTKTKQEVPAVPILPAEPIEVKGIGNEPVNVEEQKEGE